MFSVVECLDFLGQTYQCQSIQLDCHNAEQGVGVNKVSGADHSARRRTETPTDKTFFLDIKGLLSIYFLTSSLQLKLELTFIPAAHCFGNTRRYR